MCLIAKLYERRKDLHIQYFMNNYIDCKGVLSVASTFQFKWMVERMSFYLFSKSTKITFRGYNVDIQKQKEEGVDKICEQLFGDWMYVIQGLEKKKLKVSGAVKANGLLPVSNRSLLFYQQDRGNLSAWQSLGVKLLFILDSLPVCWLSMKGRWRAVWNQ